jgi:Flp pilus assembly protein TadG
MARLIKRLFGKDEGAELIEMALVLPLLLLLIMGMIDFGFLFQRYLVLTNAAVEGARIASLPGYTNADVTARVASYATNGGVLGPVNTATAAVILPGPWAGTEVTVTHVYTYQFVRPIATLFSGGLNPGVTLTARATMRNQVAAAP